MSPALPGRLKAAAFGALRLAFRLLPLADGTRDRWRQRFLARFPGLRPQPVRGRPGTAGDGLRRARLRSDQPALGHVAHRAQALPQPLPATLVSFYLPQFHPIPENDAWWGKGFTEWRNVARALPQFEGQVQPRLPADLGFYDLRNGQVMREQARLAAEYGIGAFCFYFYWFGGKTLLEGPLQQWLEDRSIELPFCLCWANENWSRRWDGREQDVLVGQQHSAADDLAFIVHVARYLRDPRYLRVDGKPLLLVYRPGLLPEPAATVQRWRQWCRDTGLGEIELAYVQSFERPEPASLGFDAAVEFPPNMANAAEITADQRLLNPDYTGQVLDWRVLAADYRARELPGYRLFPGVNCGWDNEPRRPGKGRSFLHASPRRYRDWLADTVHRRLRDRPAADRLVFINAWNEWAEGAVLEPDQRLGHAWLQATRDALLPSPPRPQRPCVVVHAWHLDVFDSILDVLSGARTPLRLVVTTDPEHAAGVRERLAARGLEAEVEVAGNRGRDILPFLRVANRLLDEGEDWVLKLHTKRSPHLPNGADWAAELLAALAGNGRLDAIVAALPEQAAQLGMVAAEGHLLPVAQFLGGNGPGLDYLQRRLGLGPAHGQARFPSGSMFWVRLEALRPLLDAHLDEEDFEAEAGQVDSTLAHAIERVLGHCLEHGGYRITTAAALCGQAGPDGEGGQGPAYRYARPA
jgi:lipopolysaccharide biosynthesis protein